MTGIGRSYSWLWMHDEKGNFTVRSCYRQLVGEHSVTDASFWRRIWTLEVPGKVTFFIWRTCKLCLPTASALREKRVDIEGGCSWCRVEIEDVVHVLFQCSFARQVSESMGITTWVQILPGETVLDIFNRLFATGNMEQWVLIATLCWSLWNRRNKWLWNKVEMSVFGTKHAALNLLADWKRAQQERTKYKSVSNSSSRHWQTPPVGWVKVNIDAAIFLQNNAIGVGGVMRNEDGSFVCAMCQQMEGLWQSREAEAISLREVLSWTKKHGYTRCVFETDSKLLADAYNGGRGNSYFHSIVNDCVEISKHFESVLVQFVHRSANEVAHLLARASHSESGLREWNTVAPDFIMDVMFANSI